MLHNPEKRFKIGVLAVLGGSVSRRAKKREFCVNRSGRFRSKEDISYPAVSSQQRLRSGWNSNFTSNRATSGQMLSCCEMRLRASRHWPRPKFLKFTRVACVVQIRQLWRGNEPGLSSLVSPNRPRHCYRVTSLMRSSGVGGCCGKLVDPQK